MFEILGDEDVHRLSEAVLEVLADLGMICHNEEILRALEGEGAVVDYHEERARFPRPVVEAFVDRVTQEDKAQWAGRLGGENTQTLYSGYVPPATVPARFRAPCAPYLFHALATFYYDDEKQQNVQGRRDEFIALTKLGEVLHPERGVGHTLILSDVPSVVEPLEAARLLLEYTRTPRGVYVQDLRQIDYLLEIEEVAGVADPYWHWLANVSFATPLKLGKDVAERFVYMVRTGLYPAKAYSMAVSGVNTPVTTAGTTVLTACELLALWMCARALDPGIPLTGLVLAGAMDMRSGQVRYGTSDTLMRRLSVAEFLRKWTSVPVSAGVGEYASSREPGLYTALEKAYAAMTVAAFTGHHPEVGIGHVQAGLAISPVQFLLDTEITEGLRFLESPAVDEESIGLDTILEVGFGQERSYLETQHTRDHFKSALWTPRFLDPAGWSRRAEETVLCNAKQRVREALAEYRQPEADPDTLSKVDGIIARARRRLVD